MNLRLGLITVLVENYQTAVDFYRNVLGCEIIKDTTGADSQRYLHLNFKGTKDQGIWLLKPHNDEQRQKIGNQTSGQPLMVIYTDNINEVILNIRRENARIIEKDLPLKADKFVKFSDLYGNEIIIIQSFD